MFVCLKYEVFLSLNKKRNHHFALSTLIDIVSQFLSIFLVRMSCKITSSQVFGSTQWKIWRMITLSSRISIFKSLYWFLIQKLREGSRDQLKSFFHLCDWYRRYVTQGSPVSNIGSTLYIFSKLEGHGNTLPTSKLLESSSSALNCIATVLLLTVPPSKAQLTP